MIIPVAEPIFIDTNILVYANVASAPFHVEALTTVLDYWKNGNVLWVSRQVLREFLPGCDNTATTIQFAFIGINCPLPRTIF